MEDVFAGIDAGGTRIKIGLANRCGQLLGKSVLETRECQDAESFAAKIAERIEQLRENAPVRVLAAGVGCPGRIDFTSGQVVWLKGKFEFLEGAALAALIGDKLRCPVVCDNDVNAILAGEMRFGAGRGHRNVIGLAVGTGIGGALCLDGHIIRGHNYAAGHFGFMSCDPEGLRHVCGNTGIVEEQASQSGILRQIRSALQSGEESLLTAAVANGSEPGFRELFAALDAGDWLAQELVKKLNSELGALVANLVYAFDPEVVLVGGGLVSCRPGIVDAVRRQAAGRLQYLPKNGTRILPMALGDSAGILGGATLAMDLTTN